MSETRTRPNRAPDNLLTATTSAPTSTWMEGSTLAISTLSKLTPEVRSLELSLDRAARHPPRRLTITLSGLIDAADVSVVRQQALTSFPRLVMAAPGGLTRLRWSVRPSAWQARSEEWSDGVMDFSVRASSACRIVAAANALNEFLQRTAT